jgi:hypothetical protein
VTTAAIIAVVLLGVTEIFQLGLAAGAPWGKASWGGKHAGALPPGLRIASGVVAIVVYPLIALFVLDSAGLIDLTWLPGTRAGMWIVTAFFALGAVANFASRSRIERVWGPVALVIAVCSGIIALNL